jgi:hypothetical protein
MPRAIGISGEREMRLSSMEETAEWENRRTATACVMTAA